MNPLEQLRQDILAIQQEDSETAHILYQHVRGEIVDDQLPDALVQLLWWMYFRTVPIYKVSFVTFMMQLDNIKASKQPLTEILDYIAEIEEDEDSPMPEVQSMPRAKLVELLNNFFGSIN